MKKVAIYAGSFDPITLGHLDIIKRASKLFDRIIVALGTNTRKSSVFSDQERTDLILKCCRDLPNVEVSRFEGLVTDYAGSIGASYLVRGVRNEQDFAYEYQMHLMNKVLKQSIETVFIPTSQMYSHISSTLVREIALLGGPLSELVSKEIEADIRQRIK
jgi:pantetheine-phosphate adenylyltransferase